MKEKKIQGTGVCILKLCQERYQGTHVNSFYVVFRSYSIAVCSCYAPRKTVPLPNTLAVTEEAVPGILQN